MFVTSGSKTLLYENHKPNPHRSNNQIIILVTLLNSDEGINSSNIQQKLQESLQKHPNAASLQVLDTVIHGMLLCVFILHIH